MFQGRLGLCRPALKTVLSARMLFITNMAKMPRTEVTQLNNEVVDESENCPALFATLETC